MSKARELADLGSVTTRLDEVGNTDGALSNRNLIINGEFLVWQRSDNGRAGGTGYVSADRFSVTRGRIRKPNTNGNTGEDNRGAVFDTTDNDVYAHFDYKVEDVGQKLNGKTMTFSFYAKVLSGATGVYIQKDAGGDYLDFGSDFTLNLTSNWERYTITGTIVSTGDASGILMPRLYLNPTGAANPRMIQVDQFQLEQGDTATPFEHRSYGDELARCQRYYYQRDWTETSYEIVFMPTWCNGTNSQQIMFYHPVQMRTDPTCSHNGAGNFRVNNSTGQDEICNGIIFTKARVESAIVAFTKATANLTVGDSGYINTEVGNDASFYIDAEL